MVSYNGMDDGVDVDVDDAEYYIQLFLLRAMRLMLDRTKGLF